ncbi:MAG: Hsp33 family molecular chaperone HslO [Oscillospiraceae bacterium]|jgi:molecular chaperone Hsp33|nr:Hsp33 family molecular chaperone HslO [Oscillospiraceae bacterium]
MDQIIRVIAKDAPVKAMAITARDTVERARAIHDCWPVASAALGRLLMAASMMGAVLKAEEGSVTLRVRGGGPLGALTAVSDSGGNVRGYVQNPAVDVPRKAKGKLDVGAAVGGEGDLTVIRDLGMKEPYIGSVQLVGGEIAEDIAAYFVESEQIPTACALGVLIAPDQTVQAAGGYLIQLLPGADDAVVSAVERGVARLGAVSARLDGGMEPLELLQEVLADFELEVLETTPIEYRCYCSEERVSRALISLGREELDKLIREQDGAELTCQFCDRVYRYSGDQLRALREELDQPAAPGPEEAE